MGYEYGPDDMNDHTTEAIRRILATLEEQAAAGQEGSEPVMPSFTDTRSPDVFDHNQMLEGKLIQAGVFKTRGELQRQVLGCLGCQSQCVAGDVRGIRPQTIAECTGGSLGGVRRVIGQLRGEGLVEAKRYSNYAARGQRPEWLSVTAEWAAYDGPPQAPPVCGPERPAEPNTAAEQLLLDEGALGWRGHLPKAILGCLACQLRKGESGVYSKGVSNCQNSLPGSTNAALRNLSEAGALDAHEERAPGGKGGRSRVVYRPAQNQLGQALAALLEQPLSCGLETKQPHEKGPAAA